MSYVEFARPQLNEKEKRRERTAEAIDLLDVIINGYSEFENGTLPMTTREVCLTSDPNEEVWFTLYEKNGFQILPDPNKTHKQLAQLVARADLWLGSPHLNERVFSINTELSVIVDHDGQPLDLAGVEGVIVDLNRYIAALTHEKELNE